MEIKFTDKQLLDTAVDQINEQREEIHQLNVKIQERDKEINRMVTQFLQESINKTQGNEVKRILLDHLGKMLDEHEAFFDRFGRFESVEFANDYIEAAKAAKFLGRKVDRIEDVQEWVNSPDSLPFE